jgi:hypothetical protein
MADLLQPCRGCGSSTSPGRGPARSDGLLEPRARDEEARLRLSRLAELRAKAPTAVHVSGPPLNGLADRKGGRLRGFGGRDRSSNRVAGAGSHVALAIGGGLPGSRRSWTDAPMRSRGGGGTAIRGLSTDPTSDRVRTGRPGTAVGGLSATLTTPGDEAKFGDGKVAARTGWGSPQRASPRRKTQGRRALLRTSYCGNQRQLSRVRV